MIYEVKGKIETGRRSIQPFQPIQLMMLRYIFNKCIHTINEDDNSENYSGNENGNDSERWLYLERPWSVYGRF